MVLHIPPSSPSVGHYPSDFSLYSDNIVPGEDENANDTDEPLPNSAQPDATGAAENLYEVNEDIEANLPSLYVLLLLLNDRAGI